MCGKQVMVQRNLPLYLWWITTKPIILPQGSIPVGKWRRYQWNMMTLESVSIWMTWRHQRKFHKGKEIVEPSERSRIFIDGKRRNDIHFSPGFCFLYLFSSVVPDSSPFFFLPLYYSANNLLEKTLLPPWCALVWRKILWGHRIIKAILLWSVSKDNGPTDFQEQSFIHRLESQNQNEKLDWMQVVCLSFRHKVHQKVEVIPWDMSTLSSQR